jgi:protein phosphatase
MQFEAFGHSAMGASSTDNEDYFLVDPDNGLFIVADGVSTTPAGEMASQMAVETVQKVLLESEDPDETRLSRDIMDEEESLRERLRYAMGQACATLRQYGELHRECRGMSTTLTILVVEDDIAHFSHVGDSRLYLFRNDRLRRLTRDHTVVQKEVDAGRLSVELAKIAPSRHVLTQSIGSQGAIEPVTSTRPVEEEDVFLLCTDGLTDVLDDSVIESLLQEHPGEELAYVLVDAAIEAGGEDNISVIVVKALD